MMKSRFFYVLFSTLAAGLILSGVVGGYVTKVIFQPITFDENQETYLYIKPGTGVLRAGHIAENMKLIKSYKHFLLTSSFYEKNTALQAGEYRIKQGMTLKDLLFDIVHGRTFTRKITIPEGLTSLQVNALLSSTFGIEYDLKEAAAEGSLAPETYHFARGVKASVLISRMQKAQSNHVFRIMSELSNPRIMKYLKTDEDLITLASIIEKETSLEAERPIIAAVFINRLNKRMRLQSDPTVIYGITASGTLGRPISKKDLRLKNTYNTYRIKGLPEGPIANPGLSSLEAAIYPASVKYLYFVADGTGGHVFAKTLRQHNRNVKKWRQFQKANKP